jgi:membrane-associated phospholipid phosphatase
VLCLSVFLSLFIISGNASAGNLDHDIANFLSHNGNLAFLAAGPVSEWISGGKRANSNAFRDLDSMLASGLIAEGMKQFIHEERPDGSSNDSFPSGHATVAFSLAATESALHPRYAYLWYGGATAISWSRTRLRRHHTRDLVAGAALGYGIARLSMSQRHGLILTPMISPGTNGMQMSMNW